MPGERRLYDPENNEQLLAAPVKIVDCGDADVLHGDIEYSFNSIEYSVRKILEKGQFRNHGGDHSITIPVGRALESLGRKHKRDTV